MDSTLLDVTVLLTINVLLAHAQVINAHLLLLVIKITLTAHPMVSVVQAIVLEINANLIAILPRIKVRSMMDAIVLSTANALQIIAIKILVDLHATLQLTLLDLMMVASAQLITNADLNHAQETKSVNQIAVQVRHQAHLSMAAIALLTMNVILRFVIITNALQTVHLSSQVHIQMAVIVLQQVNVDLKTVSQMYAFLHVKQKQLWLHL